MFVATSVDDLLNEADGRKVNVAGTTVTIKTRACPRNSWISPSVSGSSCYQQTQTSPSR